MANVACIFHHPFPVEAEGASGSRVRPYQMLRAFEGLRYEVATITGYAREREQHIKRLGVEIAKGRRFDFAYSESHTLPLLLTEPHHLPSHPFMDRGLFRQLNRGRIPLGLYYRDVHWRFDQFKAHYSSSKRLFATYFYWQEWNQYRRFVDHLFLPSLGMVAALPTPWDSERLSPLPPGFNDSTRIRRSERSSSATLQLLYVGGVTPPLYDLTPLLDSIGTEQRVRLTLCCRHQEWEMVAGHYAPSANVEVVHASGEQLNALYQQADLVAILWEPNPYLDFAMPVKVFEAIGHGLPILTVAGTETARFVEQEDIGWVLKSPADFRVLAEHLLAHPAELDAAYQKVASVQGHHTWTARAQQVVTTLSGLKS